WDVGTVPLRLVAAGILAANAHNAQAWRFAVGPRRIDVRDDVSRSLGTVDAFRREIHLSAGCAIENVALAAGAAGFVPTVTLTPTGDPALLARIDLAPDPSVQASELYRAIPLRHTDRFAYESGRELPADVVRGMSGLVDRPDVRVLWLVGPAERTAFATLTVAATEAFIGDAQQSQDDYDWYRSTSTEIQTHRDGVTADAAGLSPLLRSLGKLIPASQASNNSYWLAGTRDRQLPTASGFAVILVRDAADVAQRLGAGRVYQRMHLWATTRGMAMQPLNQIVERAERERVLGGAGPIGRGLTALVADPAWQPVMPFRIGYPTTAAPASPRRAMADVVVGAP
ncbi:MAG: hypothetical protein H0X35_01900, partial [Pseudonocardiales bacterium]|nr:hypothetical protein [Pseudonocardiales bacterium]